MLMVISKGLKQNPVGESCTFLSKLLRNTEPGLYLKLKFYVTAVSENTNENIIIAEVSLRDVLESCFFSPKC